MSKAKKSNNNILKELCDQIDADIAYRKKHGLKLPDFYVDNIDDLNKKLMEANKKLKKL